MLFRECRMDWDCQELQTVQLRKNADIWASPWNSTLSELYLLYFWDNHSGVFPRASSLWTSTSRLSLQVVVPEVLVISREQAVVLVVQTFPSRSPSTWLPEMQ